MRNKFLLALVVLSPIALLAGDAVTRLNIKEGLWEMTTERSMTGTPPIPADSLAKMTPEQRVRVESMMKQNGVGAPVTDVRKECVTKEKLDQQSAFNEDNKDRKCSRTVVSSTGTRMEMKIHCEGSEHNTDGTFRLEALGSDSVKGAMQFDTNGKGRTMNMSMTFSGRYLGPACGDVK